MNHAFAFARKHLTNALLLVLVMGMVLTYTVRNAEADHEPANKVAAAGSEEVVFGPNAKTQILQERVKLPTTHDMILSVTLECSIITALKLGDNDVGGTDSDSAEGTIDIWIEIDGRIVPVSSDDATDTGRVTFCNQLHQQRLTDSEGGTGSPDGIDTLEDFLRTKNANAFNWMALNGFTYDDTCTATPIAPGCGTVTAANGNNILDIRVYAELEESAGAACTLGSESCSDAIIGHRTLIAEPTNASVHEAVNQTDPTGGT